MSPGARRGGKGPPRRSSGVGGWRLLGLIGIGLSLVFLVVVPLWELGVVGLEQVGIVGPSAVERVLAGNALTNTLWVGVAVAVLGVTGGAAAAFVTERVYGGRSGGMRVAVMAPLLIPGYVSALSFARTYGPSGVTADLAGIEIPGLFGPVGIVVVLSVNALPIAYLVTVAALRARIEPELEQAAAVHGASRVVVLRTVVAPLLTPALVGAAALVFVSAVNAFGAPAFLGTPAGFVTVTTRIYQDLALSARPEAFSRAVLLAIMLVVVALVLVLVAERLLATSRRAVRTGVTGGWSPPVAGASRVPGALVYLAVLATTGGPLVVLVLTALTRGAGLAPVPRNWTLANFTEALGTRFGGALGRSLLLSLSAATIVVILGSMVAAFRRRAGALRSAVLLTFAVPGSTLAVAVLLAYGGRLRDTLLLILIAYVAKLWGVGHRVVEGAAGSFAPDLYRAARVGGASAPVAAATVVAPVMRPALAGAWLVVFVVALHELTMSSLLYGPGTDTLAVVVLNLQQLGDVGVASAVAVLLTVPVVMVALVIVAIPATSRLLLGDGR